MRRLKVLIFTSKELFKPDTEVVGETPESLGDNEAEDYIELLSACNIPFDIKYHDEISFENIIAGGVVHYSTIILAVSEKSLSTGTINTLRRVSREYGVSIIASYDRIGSQTKELFGINRVKGTRLALACTILIDKNKVLDSEVEPEIKLGDGWRIPLQTWGLRRHPVRYIKKHIKKFIEQVFTYTAVEVSPDSEIMAWVKGKSDPAILKYQYGNAINYYVSLQSDTYLDRINSLHRIVRELIRHNSGWGMVEFNLADTMVLRMDDPGTCERVYLKGYDTEILGKEAWHRIIELLKRHEAKLSVMYVPLWVDDANPENGKLFVNDKEITDRKGGATYQSRNVRFIKQNGNNGTRVYDYATEFRALKESCRSGWIDIESHGLTHLDTDLDGWLAAKDRYSNLNWYHEFRHVPKNRDATRTEQTRVLQDSAKRIKEFFGILPSVVTPSGHEQSENSEQIAHENGYRLFSSEYNSIQKNGLIIRNDKIKSIFLDATKPEPSFSNSGYPVVGVFHDFDIVKRGIEWLDTVLENWKRNGISKFVTLRELAGYLCASVEAYQHHNKLYCEINIANTGDIANNPERRYFFDHAMEIDVTLPQKKIPWAIVVGGNLCREFEYDKANDRVKLALPPFQAREKQEIVIIFAPTDSKN